MIHIPISELVKLSDKEIRQKFGETGLFYDWFCSDRELSRLTKWLLEYLREICKLGPQKFDPNNTYAFFKHNNNNLSDIRICDWNAGTVLYTIVPYDYRYADGYDVSRIASVWYKGHGFDPGTEPHVFVNGRFDGELKTQIARWFAK